MTVYKVTPNPLPAVRPNTWVVIGLNGLNGVRFVLENTVDKTVFVCPISMCDEVK